MADVIARPRASRQAVAGTLAGADFPSAMR
jgi:hypothetical protein